MECLKPAAMWSPRRIFLSNSGASATLALRAPKGFELGSKWRPISAVFCLLGACLSIQRFPQCLALARNSQAEQRAAAGLGASFVGESLGQLHEALRCSGFRQPKRYPLSRGFAAQRPIMAFNQGINHWPVLLALGFLRLDQVFHGKEFEGLPVLVSDRRPSGPEHFKFRESPQTSHHVHAQSVGPAALTSEMRRVAARQQLRIELWHGDPLGIEFAQRGQEPGEVLLRGQQRQVHIFAKLRRAVQHAGLAAHKQRLYLMVPDRRKDLSDRGRDQGCLPLLSTGRRASRFAGSVRWESASATPAIPRASLRRSHPQSNRASNESNSNYSKATGNHQCHPRIPPFPSFICEKLRWERHVYSHWCCAVRQAPSGAACFELKGWSRGGAHLHAAPDGA